MSGLAPPDTVIRSDMSPGAGSGHQPAAQLVGLGNGRRQADRLQAGLEAAQPRQAERQQMPALRGDQRMQLVEHDVAQIREEALGVAGRDQQRQLLGRGEQDVGRRELLALPLVRRRVAGAGLHGERQAHLADRLAEIALDVDGQRLERRDVERVDAAMRFAGPALRAGGQLGQRRQEAGQRLAGAGRRDQQHRLAGLRRASRSIWWARGDQPRSANHFRNGSGRRAAALSGSRRAWLVTPQR